MEILDKTYDYYIENYGNITIKREANGKILDTLTLKVGTKLQDFDYNYAAKIQNFTRNTRFENRTLF